MAIKTGDTIKVEYTGTLNDGSTFDSSVGREPLEFVVGSGQVIPGFDKAVIDMQANEEKTFTIPSAQAYGDREEELVQTVERAKFPMEPTLGALIGVQTPDGMQIPAKIVNVTDTHVTIDFNHPLAGQDLTFKIKIVA